MRVMGLKTVTLIVTAIFALGTSSLQPLAAQTSSESERLEKLERAVEQLEKRNAELEQEVRSLRKQTAFTPEYDANGNKKPRAASDGKTLLEKPVAAEEKKPVYVMPGGPEYKLTLV